VRSEIESTHEGSSPPRRTWIDRSPPPRVESELHGSPTGTGGFNLAAVALANKLARVAWRVWRDERDFEPRRAA